MAGRQAWHGMAWQAGRHGMAWHLGCGRGVLAAAEHQDGLDGGGEHGVRGKLISAVGGGGGARRVAQRGHR
jgi:hypothetical protein